MEKTILIDKNGFGISSLFTKESTKAILVEQGRSKRFDSGLFLSELGIEYAVGDEIRIKSEAKLGGFYVHDVKVYDITDKEYKCEFIRKPL